MNLAGLPAQTFSNFLLDSPAILTYYNFQVIVHLEVRHFPAAFLLAQDLPWQPTIATK
jgi:hypothetical protein